MGSIVMEPDDIASYASIYNPSENHSSICMPVRMIQSRGIFNNQNPFDYSVPLLLAQLSLASLFIMFTSRLLKPLGQPSMVVQILGGLTLGPSFVGRIPGFTALFYPFRSLIILDALAVFGYMFYFFLIGVQMDPWILKKIDKREFTIGISTVAFGLLLSISGSFILLGFAKDIDLDVARSLPATATVSSIVGFPVIAHYLTELKMVNSEFGRMALASSVVGNLFGFCVITLTLLSSQQSGEKFVMLQTIGAGLVLVALIILVFRPLILLTLRRYSEGEPLKQGFIYILFVGVLVTGFLSKAIGLNIFFGPLIYGMAIPAGPPLGSALVEKLDLITSWLFMPLYFVKNGLVTDIFSIKFKNYLIVQSIILVASLGKFLGAILSCIHAKLPIRDAVSIGLVVNAQGVLELGLFKMMKQSKAIGSEAFVVLCISMLIVTASATILLRVLYDPHGRYPAYKRRTILHMKPDSPLRLLVCIHDQHNVPITINLLQLLQPTRETPIDICILHMIELVGRSIPLLIPHKLTNTLSSNASMSKSIVNAFRLFQQAYLGSIIVHPFTAISSYATMHDEARIMAIERRASLIMLPFHKRFSAEGRLESCKKGIMIMNEKILQIAPCSVAIIVDHSLVKPSSTMLESWPSYRIAVLFLGGPDDRESLAIGGRMAGQPNVSLTVVRILENGNINGCVDTEESKLDNDVVSDVRYRMVENPQFVYVEEIVRDGTGTVGVIRSMERQYELVIVGRRHDVESPLILGLSDWSEESELGTLGDMFASTDFNSNITIMVVQQHTNVLSYLP